MAPTIRLRDGEHGTGWLRDYPDHRDFTVESQEVQALLAKTDAGDPQPPATLPTTADLRAWCSGIEDQGQLGSCTANAGVGMLEYYERKAHGKHINASRRFLYKVTRKLGGFEGDSGAFLRTTIGAMALFGVPPEQYWKYSEKYFDREPPPFTFAFAQNYQALTYYRLDPPGTTPADLLTAIKTHLNSQLPSMFGFTCYESLYDAGPDGGIPFPRPSESVVGGHAIMAVGYDDAKEIKNHGQKTTGAFLIRNSWGTSWGMDGYGWLPYEYVLQSLADDWWVLLSSEWVDTAEFKT